MSDDQENYGRKGGIQEWGPQPRTQKTHGRVRLTHGGAMDPTLVSPSRFTCGSLTPV